jgi:hypothetical protein
MAIDPTNYINTWNNSSVLQQQFPDVNDYVALFGSSYTPFTSSTSSTPSTSSESGVGSLMEPKIIDDIDDGGDQGITGPTGPSFGPVTGQGNVSKTDIVGTPLDQITRGVEGIVDFYGKYSPINLAKKGVTKIGEYGFGKYNAFVNAREARNQVTKDVFNKQLEEQLAADLAAAAKAQQIKDYGDYGEAGGSYGGQGNTGTGPGDFHSDDYDMKDGGRVGFAEGGSYWQTVQEAYDSAGGQDGTGLGFFDFADMYFPNPMANGGIVSLAGGGGVGMPPIAYPIIDTPYENLTAGVSQNKDPFISYTKQFDAFGGEGGMGVYKEKGQDPSFGMHYRKQFEPGGGINSLFRKK